MSVNHDLFCAIEKGNIENVKLAITNDANVNIFGLDFKDLTDNQPCPDHERYELEPFAYDPSYQPSIAPLHLAAKKGNKDIMTVLLENDAILNIRDYDNNTALHYAGSADAVELLIDRGENIDVQGEYNATPLQAAIRAKRTDVAKKLIAKGAHFYAEDEHSRIALHYAAHFNESDVAELLIKPYTTPLVKPLRKQYVNHKDRDSRTSLHTAVYWGNESIVKLLIKNEANVNVQDKNGTTPLHLAVQQNRENIVKLLLEQGADMSIRDKHSGTPLDLARYRLTKDEKYADVVSLLEAFDIYSTAITESSILKIESTMAEIAESNKDITEAISSTGASLSKRSISNILYAIDISNKAKSIEQYKYDSLGAFNKP